LPPPLSTSAIEDHLDVAVIAEPLQQILVKARFVARDDEEMAGHRPVHCPSTLCTASHFSSRNRSGSIRNAIREGVEILGSFEKPRETVRPIWKIFRRGSPVPRVIVVVARDRQDLFDYFERVFAGMADIRVLLDRRILPPGACPESSGAPGRRERRDIYDELQQRGFVMIRVG